MSSLSPLAPARLRLLTAALLAYAVASASEMTPPVYARTPTPSTPAQPGDLFAEVAAKSGLNFVHAFYHHRIANILLSNGAGGAVFDYDGDGWMDIYLVNWCALDGVSAAPAATPREPNRLFRNRGDGTFEDVTERAGLAGSGYASAATTGDFDNDGHPDLYVVNFGQNHLYRNRGDGTFEDVTARAGVGDRGTGISAVFFDADRDGWLDLYVVNYLTFTPEKESEQNPGAYPGPLAYPGEANVLYRNRGDGTFEDVTRAAGLHAPGHRGMSVSAFDANRDGAIDLYVSNDDTPNQLWLNDGHGRFTEMGIEAGVAFNSIGEAPGSMNATIGDANNDGRPDLFVTRLGYGSLYVRTPAGSYDDRMWASGLGRLTQKFVGWGGEFLDFDNDGDDDLVIANGDAFTIEGTLPLLPENQGGARFTDAGAKGGAFFRTKLNGRGLAVLDFDNDGRQDVLITTLADRAFLLHNTGTTLAAAGTSSSRPSTPNHWLTLRLEGTRSNRSGYGALLTLKAGDLTIESESRCPTGFLMQGDSRPHFGLGSRTTVDRLEIRWPSGQVQVLTGIAVDQILNVKEPQS